MVARAQLDAAQVVRRVPPLTPGRPTLREVVLDTIKRNRRVRRIGRQLDRVARPHVRRAPTRDGTAAQTTTSCDEYVGELPLDSLSGRKIERGWFGVGGTGRCPSCRAEVPLDVRGRIVEHEPGPPPVRSCPICNRSMSPRYNAAPCDSCAKRIDREHAERLASSDGAFDYGGAWQ